MCVIREATYFNRVANRSHLVNRRCPLHFFALQFTAWSLAEHVFIKYTDMFVGQEKWYLPSIEGYEVGHFQGRVQPLRNAHFSNAEIRRICEEILRVLRDDQPDMPLIRVIRTV